MNAVIHQNTFFYPFSCLRHPESVACFVRKICAEESKAPVVKKSASDEQFLFLVILYEIVSLSVSVPDEFVFINILTLTAFTGSSFKVKVCSTLQVFVIYER